MWKLGTFNSDRLWWVFYQSGDEEGNYNEMYEMLQIINFGLQKRGIPSFLTRLKQQKLNIWNEDYKISLQLLHKAPLKIFLNEKIISL